MRELARALETLRSGGVVAVATESSFGLLAVAQNPQALDRLFEVKPRDAARGVGLMVPNLASARQLARAIDPRLAALADAFWPGPLTLVVPAHPGLDPRLVVDGRVALRVPGPSPAADVVTALGEAVTATSANPTGEPPCSAAADLQARFAVEIAAGKLDWISRDAPGGLPSTFLAAEAEGIRILRPGAIGAQALERVLNLAGLASAVLPPARQA